MNLPFPERVERAARGARGVVVVLSANPMHDTGGGQRSAQMALEFLERDHCVVFVSHGRVTETVDLGLRYPQPRLVEASLRAVVGRDGAAPILCAFRQQTPAAVITQVPVRSWLPVLLAAREAEAVTVYDCVDRWDSELGRGWYRADAEEAVASACDVLVASAPELVRHVERLAEREVHLLPNAFNDRIFSSDLDAPRPVDLPPGRVALYVGALWGGWMDWRLVAAAAERLPDTRFVFIGDHRGEGEGLPANCVFLGLKAQAALPPYLAHADVAFMPWVDDALTRATSPLKAYEFVAMGLPVVAPPLDPLKDIPGMVPARGTHDFLSRLAEVDRAALDESVVAEMRRFAETNAWRSRIDTLDRWTRFAARDREAVPEAGAAPVPGRARRAARAVLSVVVPSYNHARFVGQAVDSVRAQSLPAGDLVVVDDGSADASREVLEAHRFRGMRCLYQENHGAHEAINRAIARSAGDYVQVLNSDDLLGPERLEHGWAVARATGAALVIGGVRWIDERGDPLPPDHEGVRWYRGAIREASTARSLRAAVTRHNVAVTTSNFFLHRALWRALGGFRAFRYAHDLDFLLRALALCPERVVFEPSMVDVCYRIHGANTIAEDTSRALAERSGVVRALRSPVATLRSAAFRPRLRRKVRRAVEASGLLAPTPPDRGEDRPAAAGATRRAADARGLRVGLVVPALGLGGLEEVVALLATTLPAQGVRPFVLCARRGGPVADRLRAAGVDVVDGRGDAARWRRWAADVRPDVISTHFVDVDVVETLAPLGAPLVETVHNTYAWLTPEAWAREQRKLERLTATVAVSVTAARYHAMHTDRDPTPHVIPNAVDPSRVARAPRNFARSRLGLDPRAPVLLHLGRVTRQKNPTGLVRAFGRAEAELPGAVLLLAGPRADRGLVREVRRARPDLFRRRAVRLVDPPPHVGLLVSAADAFVSNSFFEGWSVAASEALWAGLPLVLSECGGARELVGPSNERGRVVSNPAGDPLSVGPATLSAPPGPEARRNEVELAAAIVELVRERGRWRETADGIRAHARETLAPHRMAGAYAKLFRCLV